MNNELIATGKDTRITTGHGLIRVTGRDAETFLHNLLTQNIRQLPVDQACFAGFCTAQGRLIASLMVWRDHEDFLLAVSADILPSLLKKLSTFIFRSQVKLFEVDGTDRIPIELSDLKTDIAAGRPRIVAATQEMFIPQMVNMDIPPLDGISFKKGCYPGQEVIARTQYLGKVKRRMFRARLAVEHPAGTPVFTPESGAQHCGALVNIVPSSEEGFDCLVVVQLSGVEAGEVHVGTPDGPQLSFLSLPYPLQ